jgi:hypothetical protein
MITAVLAEFWWGNMPPEANVFESRVEGFDLTSKPWLSAAVNANRKPTDEEYALLLLKYDISRHQHRVRLK